MKRRRSLVLVTFAGGVLLACAAHDVRPAQPAPTTTADPHTSPPPAGPIASARGAPEPGATPVTPDEICPVLLDPQQPVLPRSAFTVRRACTCGETISCTVSLVNDVLVVDAHARSRGCLDCSPASATCTLPLLEAKRIYEVALPPATVIGRVTTDSRGVVVVAPCLRTSRQDDATRDAPPAGR